MYSTRAVKKRNPKKNYGLNIFFICSFLGSWTWSHTQQRAWPEENITTAILRRQTLTVRVAVSPTCICQPRIPLYSLMSLMYPSVHLRFSMNLLESSYIVAKQMLDIITRSSRTGVLRFRITKTQFFLEFSNILPGSGTFLKNYFFSWHGWRRRIENADLLSLGNRNVTPWLAVKSWSSRSSFFTLSVWKTPPLFPPRCTNRIPFVPW